MKWHAPSHSANKTDEYLFHQLIPYIGNKRKLLGLIEQAITATGITPDTHRFIDLFAGTGVVSRFARHRGYGVLCNDWEPYSETINRCYVETAKAPHFFKTKSYNEVLNELNQLPDYEGWVTTHLCPRNDDDFDTAHDRMFYMRKNGLRIDAMREQIEAWDQKGNLTLPQKTALLAPLLYQCCYNANTSGVFKGFHNGWGGNTSTALYRIKGDLSLRPALFLQNSRQSQVTRMDAAKLAPTLPHASFAYLDPPYNQHPYGANYHVLNSVTLWDKPALSPQIEGRGSKAAIRQDWRTQRRSAYNYAQQAASAYQELLCSIGSEWIATSYSTDGTIPLKTLIEANLAIGDVQVFTQAYKRYRVSSQRYSAKPLNVEFILLTHKGHKPSQTLDALINEILQKEKAISTESAL
ncbi:MAG: DNA adenine methylase [Bdellovibrionales bacterium]